MLKNFSCYSLLRPAIRKRQRVFIQLSPVGFGEFLLYCVGLYSLYRVSCLKFCSDRTWPPPEFLLIQT